MLVTVGEHGQDMEPIGSQGYKGLLRAIARPGGRPTHQDWFKCASRAILPYGFDSSRAVAASSILAALVCRRPMETPS